MDKEPWRTTNTAGVMPGPSSSSSNLPDPIALNQPTADEAIEAGEDFQLKQEEVADSFKTLSLGKRNPRFFGKSSGVMMVKKAMDMKHEYSGSPKPKQPLIPEKRPNFWSPPSVKSPLLNINSRL